MPFNMPYTDDLARAYLSGPKSKQLSWYIIKSY